MKKNVIFYTAALLCAGLLLMGSSTVSAADVKIGVVNFTKVLGTSTAGKSAQKAVESKKDSLQATLKKSEQNFLAKQDEYKKKGASWNADTRQEKEIELKKMRRDLNIQKDDMNLELNTFSEDKIGPIVKKLNEIVPKVAKAQGYDIILNSNVAAYVSPAADLTDTVTSELNKVIK